MASKAADPLLMLPLRVEEFLAGVDERERVSGDRAGKRGGDPCVIVKLMAQFTIAQNADTIESERQVVHHSWTDPERAVPATNVAHRVAVAS